MNEQDQAIINIVGMHYHAELFNPGLKSMLLLFHLKFHTYARLSRQQYYLMLTLKYYCFTAVLHSVKNFTKLMNFYEF